VTARSTPEAVEALGGGWVADEALAIGVYCALVHEHDSYLTFGQGIADLDWRALPGAGWSSWHPSWPGRVTTVSLRRDRGHPPSKSRFRASQQSVPASTLWSMTTMSKTRKAKKAAKGNPDISHGFLRWLLRHMERQQAIKELGLTDVQVTAIDRIDRSMKNPHRQNQR
jgi:hypothetical protein